MSTDLQETAYQPKGLRAWVESPDARREIASAVGDIMPADQFAAHMLVAFQDPKVRACSDKSKFRALMECAAMGFLPTLGQVVLIPYKTDVKAMPTWQGYKSAMERHPDILEVIGVLVHVADRLSMEEGELHHSYDPFEEAREFQGPKDLRGGYCKIIYRDGRPPKYHIIRRKTIEQAQACAQTQNVWNKWYYEMALKTVYRNAYARRAVPIDPLVGARIEKALNIDDVNLGNDPMRITSEAMDHIEQARRQREAIEAPEGAEFAASHEPADRFMPQDPPYNPPTSGEQQAADASQVDPAVDKAEGVDDPASAPGQEVANFAKKIRAAMTITAVQEHVEIAYGIFDEDGAAWIDKAGEQRIAEIRDKRGGQSKASVQGG